MKSQVRIFRYRNTWKVEITSCEISEAKTKIEAFRLAKEKLEELKNVCDKSLKELVTKARSGK